MIHTQLLLFGLSFVYYFNIMAGQRDADFSYPEYAEKRENDGIEGKLVEEIKRLKYRIHNLDAKVLKTSQDNAILKNRVDQIRAGKETKDGIYAFMGTRTGTWTSSGKMTYNTLRTSVGGGFSTSTGKFTAPRAGLYLFNFHGVKYAGHTSQLYLYHNSKIVAATYASQSRYSWYSDMGNSAILKLKKNDYVYVGNSGYIYSNSNNVISFSGILIYPM